MADNEESNEETTTSTESDETSTQGTITPDEAKRLRAALTKANEEAKNFRLKLKELEDRDKDETTRLTESVAEVTKRAEEAERRAMRLEIAGAKGLTPKQANRLVGSTAEELEADADELLAEFVPAEKPSDPQATQDLKPANTDVAGGSDDIDYDALAASV